MGSSTIIKETYEEEDAAKRVYIAVKRGFIFKIREMVWEQSLRCNEHRCSARNGVGKEVTQVILPGKSLRVTKVGDAWVMIAVNQNIGL